MTLETCYQSDKETWIEQQKDKDKGKDKDKDKDKDLWPLTHLIQVISRHDLTNKKNNDKDKYNDEYKDKDNDKDI